jgi:glycosyltransferase involved in cell wall biosynthesis
MPARVLHVIDSLHMGGAEQLLLTLGRSIDASRFEMSVCSLSPDDSNTAISAGLRNDGVPVHRAPHLRRHDLRHLRWLTGLIRRESIDLVHTHLAYGNVVGLLTAALAGRPAVATLHSIENRHNGHPTIKRRLQGIALRRQAGIVIACSSAVADSAQRRFRIPASKLVVIPNGIDIAAYADRDPGAVRALRLELLRGRSGPLVVSVGRLAPTKGHEILLAATLQVLARFPDLQVVIVGRDAGSGGEVRSHVERLGLRPHVDCLGDRQDVADILAAADVFVLPSLVEGLPLALLEAMAAGTPVVAAAAPGIDDVVADQVTGRLVAPGDPAGLAREIIASLSDPDRARGLATAARCHVEAHHRADVWAAQVAGQYERVLGRPAYDRALAAATCS